MAEKQQEPQATVSLGWQTSNREFGKRVTLLVQDTASKAAIEVVMTLEDFALLLSGRQFLPAEILRTGSLGNWGKKILYHTVSLARGTLPWKDREGKSEHRDQLIRENWPEEPGDWVFSHYRDSQDGFHLVYARWETPAQPKE